MHNFKCNCCCYLYFLLCSTLTFLIMQHIFKRSPEMREKVSNPFPLQNFSASVDSQGKIIYTQCDPVPRCLADDYSVTENALLGRSSLAIGFRSSADLVDMEKILDN